MGDSAGLSKFDCQPGGSAGLSDSASRPRRTIGFQRAPADSRGAGLCQPRPTMPAEPLQAATAESSRPLRPAKRPKGQLLFALIFCVGLFYGGNSLWNTFFRYEGYGVVSGRVLEVSAKWDGTVSAIHVRDGDLVNQGQPLFTLDNDSLQLQFRQLEDELRVAAASLDAEIYEVQWESHRRSKEDSKSASEIHERLAELQAERTQHSVLQAQLKRMQSLKTASTVAVSSAELESLEIAEAGHRLITDSLSRAVAELKKGDATEVDHELGAIQKLRSRRAHVDALEMRLNRLGERLAEERVRSPVNGRVLRKRRFTGEFAKAGEPIVEVLEDGSLEASVYVPQRMLGKIAVGQHMLVEFAANRARLNCQVKRLGDRLEPAPSSIQRYYGRDEHLLSVQLDLPLDLRIDQALPLGSIVYLPRPTGEAVFPGRPGRSRPPVQTPYCKKASGRSAAGTFADAERPDLC